MSKMKKNNNKNTILKISFSSLFLVLSVVFSLLEIKVILPSGAEFDLRLFDTVFLLISITIVKFGFALIIAILQPWIHLMFDGNHLPVSIAFYSISNFFIVLTFWFFLVYLNNIGVNINNTKLKNIKNICFWILFIIFSTFYESFSVIISGWITSGGSQFNISKVFKFSFWLFYAIYFCKFIITVIIYSFLMVRLENAILWKV